MSDDEPIVEPFEDLSLGEPHVRGVLHRASTQAADGLVLTHGAGSNAAHPFLVALARTFAARGVTVLRCDLPFRQARPRGGPSRGGDVKDREGLRRAVHALRREVRGRIVLGGQSYGGRQASMLAAQSPDLVDALLLLSYPLHPPGRPSELRTAHLTQLSTPAFFVHGSADPFGSLDEMRAAVALVPGPTTLVPIDGAGHDLSRGRSRSPATIAERVVDEFLAWIGRQAS